MKALLDTTVLLAGMVEVHSMHARAQPWLERAKKRAIESCISSHALAELYSVLTTLPVKPRIPGTVAWQMIGENVLSVVQVVPLLAEDYAATLEKMVNLGISGGAVHDALHARAAEKARAGRLVTLNVDDFRRVWPEGVDRIILP
jgi:predicted nucleic acid-binding protein